MSWGKIEQKADIVICIGSGPSLKNFSFWELREIVKQKQLLSRLKLITIGVNGVAERLNWLDYAITCDTTVLKYRWNLPDFRGVRVAAMYPDYGEPNAQQPLTRNEEFKENVLMVKRMDKPGLSYYTGVIHGLANSGFGALGLAFHMDPSLIILFGYDFSSHGSYWYNKNNQENNNKRDFPHRDRQLKQFLLAKQQLEEAKVKVINGSYHSELPFEIKMHPNTALQKLMTYQNK